MLTKSYRGKQTQLSEYSFGCKVGFNGFLVFEQPYYNSHFNNQLQYSVTIGADELLKTARTCLSQLQRVSGIEYRMCAVVDNKIIKWF